MTRVSLDWDDNSVLLDEGKGDEGMALDSVKSEEKSLDVGRGEGLLLGTGEICATLDSGNDRVFTDSEEDKLTQFTREGLGVED